MGRFPTSKLRSWQKEARKQIAKAIKSEQHVVIPVNACVGSGKTAGVGIESFYQYIDANQNDKTFSMFVCPRIALCAQQRNEIDKFFQGTKFEKDVVTKIVNCESDEFNKNTMDISGKHVIFVVCDKSLWGSVKSDDDDADPDFRYHRWIKTFNKWLSSNRKFGSIVYDESHNYEKKQLKMFGNEYIVDGQALNRNTVASLMDFFQLNIIMSGTPADYQRGLTKTYSQYECACSLALAIEEDMVNTPVLNVIQGTRTMWPRAIEAVFNLEKENSNVIKNGLVCVSSIDEIDSILKNLSDNFKKNVHIIAIHSNKSVTDDNDDQIDIKSTIDGIKTDVKIVREKIDQIDSGKAFEDQKPIIVFQVEMIGEGININSFSWIITTSVTRIRCMQQVGRVLRKFEGKNTANVYTFFENEGDIKHLMHMLLESQLTLDNISWGNKLDISYGAAAEADADKLAKLNKFNWEKIKTDDVMIVRAQNYMQKKTKKLFHVNLKLNENFSNRLISAYDKLDKKDDLHKDIDGYLKNNKALDDNAKSVEIYYGLLTRVDTIISDAERFSVIDNFAYVNYCEQLKHGDKETIKNLFSYMFNGNEKFATLFAAEVCRTKKFRLEMLRYLDIM